ncbi:MAG TPA: hypothetical protein VN419_05765 [Humidesulfovibrio sp.]|uniref:hypothetical protein n=1 Tax=Humidesulfovibrio sp. TaxID=2910988 RepID=UPI002D0A1788|nr:hypothetical protein [Humidesulfovibrio sp.]HWR03507.1 hypothetical protein [Humidesulfovibrio sp.]
MSKESTPGQGATALSGAKNDEGGMGVTLLAVLNAPAGRTLIGSGAFCLAQNARRQHLGRAAGRRMIIGSLDQIEAVPRCEAGTQARTDGAATP